MPPTAPGIYLIRYKVTDEIYIGATKNLKKRINEHLNKFGDSAWKQKLCAGVLSTEIQSLKKAFEVVKQSLSYEILLQLPLDCSDLLLKKEEERFIKQLSPSLNGQLFSGYKTQRTQPN